MITLSGVSFSYDREPFIHDLSCTLADGRITALIGPNGSGKSTCLRLCSGLLKPHSGSVAMNGTDINAFSPRPLAKELGFLPQSRPTPQISVRSLVASGRFPYLGLTRRLSPADETAVSTALELTGLEELADRNLKTLSGGERQKAYIAMLIAQETRHMLLDEPTTYLDINHKLELLELLVNLRSKGKCIVMVLHDIDLAAEFCDDVLVMQNGRIIHTGPAADLAESGALQRAYSVEPIPDSGMRFRRI